MASNAPTHPPRSTARTRTSSRPPAELHPLEPRLLLTVFYVSANDPLASDSNPGTQLTAPLKTIGRAIALASSNNATNQTDTIYVRAGVYRERASIGTGFSGASPSSRSVLSAYVNPATGRYEDVYILGSDTLAGPWTRDGTTNRWYRTGFTSQTNQVFVDWSPANDIAPLQQIGGYNETNRLVIGTGAADMTPGSFFHDAATARLYVRLADNGDPNTHAISYSSRGHNVYLPGSPTWDANGVFTGYTYPRYFDLKGLRMRHVNPWDAFGQDYGNATYTANDERIIDCDVQWSGGTGISVYDNSQLINTIASHNAQTGAAGKGMGFLIQGGQFNYNNYLRFNGGVAAGIKVISNTPALYGDVIGVEAAYNVESPGVWYDTDYTNTAGNRVTGNFLHDNDGHGLFLEASRNFLVANNVIANNKSGGVSLNATSNAKIYNNTIVGNYGIAAVELNSGTRGSKLDGTFTGMTDNAVFNNVIANNFTTFELDLPNLAGSTDITRNTSNYNLYYRRGGPLKFTSGGTYQGSWLDTPSSLPAWRSAVTQDANSIVADPMFVPGGTGAAAYRIGSNSPARDVGANLSADLNTDYAATARPQGTAFDIGAFESVAAAGTAGAVVVNNDPTSWFDDVLPDNASPTTGDETGNAGQNKFWYWNSSPVASGAASLDSGLYAGIHQQYFTGANARTIGVNDVISASIYLDPTAPPRQLMLQFQENGSWEHRAFWGENLIAWGTAGTPSRFAAGALPQAGQWVRVSAPAQSLGLMGKSVSGFSFTLYDGRALLDNLTVVPTPPTVAAVGTTLIQAENFDDGGEAVGYHDTTSGNSGGAYRPTNVDIESTTDLAGGYNVGWTDAGEWLRYTVTVPQAGNYALSTRVASPNSNQKIRFRLDGTDVTGPLTVPNTGGWQNWTDLAGPSLSLPAGTHVLQLSFETGGINVNAFSLTGANPPLPPSNLSASPTGTSAVSLTWADNTVSETAYVVDRATDPLFTQNLLSATLPANTSSFSSTGLAAGTTLYFRVKATNAAGASAYSVAASATTPPAPATIVLRAGQTTYLTPAAGAIEVREAPAGPVLYTLAVPTSGPLRIAGTPGDDRLVITAALTAPLLFDPGAGTDRINLPAGSTSLQLTATAGSVSLDLAPLSDVTLTGTARLGPVSVGTGATLRARNLTGRVLALTDLALASGAVFDTADNDLVLNRATFGSPTIRQCNQWVINGLQGGTAARIITSQGASSGPYAAAATTLAFFDNAGPQVDVWMGVSVTTAALVAKFTFFGDVNIDGQTDDADYGVIDAFIGQTGTSWLFGDANFDGQTTDADYGVIDAFIGSGRGAPLARPAVGTAFAGTLPAPAASLFTDDPAALLSVWAALQPAS